MYGRKMATVSFNAEVSLEMRDDHWAAYVEPFGITVYGDTKTETESRLNQGIEFFLKYAPNIRKYLDSHGIPHYITEDDETNAVRRTYPVSARVESPMYA